MNQLPAIRTADAYALPDYYTPEESIKRHSRIALIAMAILVFGFGLAAAIIPIGGAVIGSGQFGVESRVKRIAHPSGGVISEIRVRDGDVVKKGQVLIRLDTTVSGVSADLSSQTVEQLLAQQARLTAERDEMARIPFSGELTSASNESARAAMMAQARLFELKRREHSGIRAQLRERVSQLNQQISGYQAQIAALRQQQVLLKPEREGVRDLWEQDLVTINRLNQLERSAVDIDGQIASLNAQIAQTQARISETREQDIQLQQQWRSEAATELAQVTAALNEQQVKSASAGDMYERSLIRAPYDGVIDKLAFATIGGVIQPAETIMEIVPVTDRMVVEAAISPSDVDRVHVGQEARIKITTFNEQSAPDLNAKVSFVAAERTTNPDNGASFYRVKIEVDSEAVKREGLEIKPGMPAEAFISTGSRTMLSYITRPLREQFDRAFRQ